MRLIFVILAVSLPLSLAAVFIVNSVVSDNFPMVRDIPIDESQYLQQTYRAALDFCENNYGDIDKLKEKVSYEKCIESVERWYAENLKS